VSTSWEVFKTPLGGNPSRSQLSRISRFVGQPTDIGAADETALTNLTSFIADGPETNLERSEGFGDIQASAAARGKLGSGGTLRDLVGFNNQLNERNRGNRLNELVTAFNASETARGNRFNENIVGRSSRLGELLTDLNARESVAGNRFGRLFNVGTLGANRS